jgi:hypothetical protein
MIDLLLVKAAEHALRALSNPPRSFIIIGSKVGDLSIYNKLPISIEVIHNHIKFEFPQNTIEEYYNPDSGFRSQHDSSGYFSYNLKNIEHYGPI